MPHNENCKTGQSANACSGLCCTKIENFGVTVGRNVILHDVNLHIHCGELTALIGPNGAGKSTLLKAILGEVKHTGDLKYLDSTGTGNKQPLFGYVPQALSFDTSTPTSVLDLFAACLTRRPVWISTSKKLRLRAENALERVKAEHLIDRRLGALSGGELQRVLLALALEPLPSLLLLDEPVSGVDQNGLEVFYDTVSQIRKEYDLSIILISHDLQMVERYADRVVLLNGTVLENGKPAKVFASENMSKIFGSVGRHEKENEKGGEADA